MTITITHRFTSLLISRYVRGSVFRYIVQTRQSKHRCAPIQCTVALLSTVVCGWMHTNALHSLLHKTAGSQLPVFLFAWRTITSPIFDIGRPYSDLEQAVRRPKAKSTATGLCCLFLRYPSSPAKPQLRPLPPTAQLPDYALRNPNNYSEKAKERDHSNL